MIWTGNDTPYNSRSKEKVPESGTSVGTLLTSDTQINTSIADIITSNARMQTAFDIIQSVCETDSVDEVTALAVISSIISGVNNK